MAIEHICNVLAAHLRDRPEILFAILYGSSGEGSDFRDLDVAVWLDRARIIAESELQYAFDLTDQLERVVPYPVDVRVINDAPLPFSYNVSCGRKLVAQDEDA